MLGLWPHSRLVHRAHPLFAESLVQDSVRVFLSVRDVGVLGAFVVVEHDFFEDELFELGRA